MKKIFYYLSVVAVLAFAGCNDNDKIAPAPKATGPQVNFGTAGSAKFDLDPEKNEIAIPVYRVDTEGSLTVSVSFSAETEDVFTFPSSVTFAAGSNKTEAIVVVDQSLMEYNVPYKFGATIVDESMTTPYGADILESAATRSLTWRNLGDLHWAKSTMWIIAPDEKLAVQKANQADIFRIPEFVSKGVGIMFEIDFENNTAKSRGIFETGIRDGDGFMIGFGAETGTYDPVTRTVTFTDHGAGNYYYYLDGSSWKPGWYLYEVFILPEF